MFDQRANEGRLAHFGGADDGDDDWRRLFRLFVHNRNVLFVVFVVLAAVKVFGQTNRRLNAKRLKKSIFKSVFDFSGYIISFKLRISNRFTLSGRKFPRLHPEVKPIFSQSYNSTTECKMPRMILMVGAEKFTLARLTPFA